VGSQSGGGEIGFCDPSPAPDDRLGCRLCENVDWVRILVVDSGFLMKRFVEGEDRRQGVLLPEYLDDFVTEENQVRVIEAFVDELDLRGLGFEGVVPEATGRPAYHPATMLKIYVYGYVNQIASSRRLEREARRNVELMADWTACAGLQDDRGLQKRQRRSDPGDVPAIRGALPKSELVHSGDRGDRRKPVQGRQLPRQIVLARLD